MRSGRCRLPLWRSLAALAFVTGQTASLRAQGVEVAPFAGYRFGGDFFEVVTEQPVDLDGAPALGVVVDVPLSDGVQVEALFTHQEARVAVPARASGAATTWQITVDHWQGGGLQEFGRGRARPFLTGMLGLTRYAAEGDSELRFVLGAGGGVKLFPWPRLGVRLDGRAFATFVDVDGRFIACSPGACFIALNTNVVWQAEFTAGMVVRF